MAGNGTSENNQIENEEEMSCYRKDSLAVTTFRIAYSENDFNSARFLQFKPEMAHQVFGESEKIFGYKFLSITLNYLHNSSQCYVDIRKSGEIQSQNMQPDDIMKSLNDWLPENYANEEEKFRTLLQNEKHDVMFGSLLYEFKDKKECSLFPEQKVEINYKFTYCDVSDIEFQDYHKRFETFIVWFIDAANFIDLDDDRWLIFYVYEEFEHPLEKKKFVSPVGFCSVYKFFSYPDKVRARISQFFVLPSHQKRGIGTKLYHVVVEKLRQLEKIADITVEEPTTTFQKIRDVDDCLTLMKAFKDSNINIFSGNPKIISNRIREFKICKKQDRKVIDILRCFEASRRSPEEYKKATDRIKNRITTQITKDSYGCKKVGLTSNGAIFKEPTDKNALIESEFKKQLSEIEPVVKYLQAYFENNENI